MIGGCSPERLAAERAALVALLRLGRRPWSECREAIGQPGGASLALERELSETGGQRLLEPPDPSPLVAAATRDMAAWEEAGLTLVTVLDPGYPVNLRLVHDHPPLIFVAGRLSDRDGRSVAVIGSRSASPAGLRAAGRIARHLVEEGWTVISGLAAGIDTAAHRATLDAGGRTLAVIGTGLERAYPAQNASLQRLIASRHAVVSQFWPDARPSRSSFPQRNAVMSGLARASVVVEAGARSGARVQARIALAHGRPVFVTEPSLSEPWIRDLAGLPGVHVASAPSDITATLTRLHSDDLRE